ncbi:hypothetical protein ACFYPK_07510 [Streptomyces halstedii]
MSNTPRPKAPPEPPRNPVLADLIWLQKTRAARLAAARALDGK